MAGQSRLICVSALLAILLNAPVFATSSPLPPVNGTNQQTNPALKPRVIPTPDADGWIPFDSVGMMLPVKLTEDSDTSPPPGCNTVECKQRMSYMSSSSGGVPLPPGLGLTRRDLPRQGSRDLVRRKAAIGLDDAGEPVYRLADYDDDEEEEDDNGDDEEEDVEDYGDDEEGYYEGDEDDENDENSLAKRHLPLLKGVSVLGTPTFSRRSEGFLASLFRRKKKNSKKVADLAKPRRKKNKSKSKSKSKQLKKIKKKGKGKFNIGGIDLMKGATILTTITWYTGIDLLNPYCDRKTKRTPTDDSMIIAVTEKWSLRPACGEFMEITTQDDKAPRSIIARVVDLCGGCIPEVPHADLSKAAFSKLYHLDVGRVHGLKMRRVGAPKRWSERLFGPKVL